MTLRELGNTILDMPYGGNLALLFLVFSIVLPVIGRLGVLYIRSK